MKIIILSRNPHLYSTNSLIVAARKRGHHVRVLDHVFCDLMIKDNTPHVYYYGEKIKGYDCLIPRIGSNVTTTGALVIRHFKWMGLATILEPQGLVESRSKYTCLQKLAENGIKVPDTGMSNNIDYMEVFLSKFKKFPLIFKLLKGTHGIGVIKLDAKNTAISIIEAFQKINQKYLLQEFIKEAKGQDIRAFVVGNKVVATMLRSAKDGEFRSNIHRGATAEKIKLNDDEYNTAVRAAEIMNLSVAGVDILRTNSGPMVIEVNASPGLEGIETVTKVNVADQIIQCLENKVYSK